jgi:hypothetical protein
VYRWAGFRRCALDSYQYQLIQEIDAVFGLYSQFDNEYSKAFDKIAAGEFFLGFFLRKYDWRKLRAIT